MPGMHCLKALGPPHTSTRLQCTPESARTLCAPHLLQWILKGFTPAYVKGKTYK